MAEARRAALAGLTLLVAFNLGASAATRAHPGPPIWADLIIGADEVRFELRGEPGPMARCLGYDGLLVGPVEPAEERAARAAVEAFFRERFVLAIDGESAAAELTAFALPVDDPDTDGWLVLEATWSAPLEVEPRRVGIRWEGFEGTDYMGERYVPVLVRRGREVAVISLLPDEPEYVWHAPASPRVRAVVTPASIGAPAPDRRPALLAAGLGGLAVLGLLLGARRRAARVFAYPLGSVALAGAAVFGWQAWHEGTGRVRMPAQDQALELFTTLHQNIYAAFDAEDEDAIYDLLAVSVDAALLDDLYAEVYESLVMREEGGAVCAIDSVEVLEREVDLEARAPDETAFAVTSSWRVHGRVAHWGHIHRRTNQYRATYTLRHDGSSWKIAAVDVHEHQRLGGEEG